MALGWRKEYLRYRSYFLNILLVYRKKEDLRMFLEIILSLVTISFFGIFALRPTFVTIAQLYNDIKTKEDTISKMDTKIANLGKAQTILNQEASRLPILETSVPVSPEPELVIHQLQGLAVTSSVKILGISIEETQLKGSVAQNTAPTDLAALPQGVKGMGFSMSTTGAYQNLFAFIQSLESLRIPVKVDILGMNLSKAEKGNSLNMTISGRVPYFGN